MGILLDAGAEAANEAGVADTIAGAGETAWGVIQGNWTWLLLGIVLIVAAVLIFIFMKKIGKVILNSALGLVVWAVLYFVVGVKMNLWVSLIISGIFGLVGIGVLLVLKFLGIDI
ncbi:hypothetical protein KKH30_02460 [Candidatus Micrarchaeota archaeon]|nr:hypothetical protein [Candidatus Micrarchaeota archaeon]